MTHNTFGRNFRIEIWGASHALEVGVRISGVGAGIPLSVEDFESDLARRRSGARGTTPRRESDIPRLRSGVVNGVTNGEAIEIVFSNDNTRSADYSQFMQHPRPSHVDFVAQRKYGSEVDLRGSGMFSGRMTVALVAAGVVAKKINPDFVFAARLVRVGAECRAEHFDEVVEAAMRDGDSVGGVVECTVTGVPVGFGEPFFDSVESVAAHLLFAVPAVKGVEFGSGFEGVKLRGSERNDRLIDASGHTVTNNEGGINGGITNSNPVVVRVAIKPTASISTAQQTYDFGSGSVSSLEIKGRHDACIALRAQVVVEAVMAITFAELSLER